MRWFTPFSPRKMTAFFSSAKRFNYQGLSVFSVQSSDGITKVAISAGSIPGAVRRNQAKRRLRQYLHTHKKSTLVGKETLLIIKKPFTEEILEKIV